MNSMYPKNKIQVDIRSETRWAFIIMCLYYVSLLGPPLLNFPTLKWYVALGLSIIAYLLNKRAINLLAVRPYLIISGLSLLGAIISIINSPSLNLSLLNTIGSFVNFIVFLLFIPVLANQKVRKYLLILIVLLALLWTVQIQLLLRAHSILLYSTFTETGSNKNSAGFVLAIAAIILFYVAVLWQTNRKTSKIINYLLRFFSGALAIYYIYCLSLIYDRSSILAVIVGIVVLSLVILIKSNNKFEAIFGIIFFLGICILVIYIFLPDILNISPGWLQQYDKIQQEGISAFPSRLLLIKKGLYIIKQNPLIGIGLGSSRSPISTPNLYFPGYYLHNSYLTDWAERGILGLFSYVIWVLLYLKTLKKYFLNLNGSDQIWLILFLLVFFSMTFADSTSINLAMLSVLSGIWYDVFYHQRSKCKVILIKER